MSASVAASTKAMRGSVGRQSPSLSQGTPHDSEANNGPSRLAGYFENNPQTSSVTTREALHRYFSNSDRPTITSDHNSADTCVAAHKAQAQAAIDAVDAAMEEQEG